MSKFKPTLEFNSVFDIDYGDLKANNIECIIFDLDNTLSPFEIEEPDNYLINFIKVLKQFFIVEIVTNRCGDKVNKFSEALEIDCIALAMKPLKRSFNKVLEKHNLSIEQVVVIGDQIFTDIWGANRLGIKSIFINHLGTEKNFYNTVTRNINKILIRK
jgi:uncharacterized protein